MKQHNKKIAFTLAEVLITLMIIGVLAIITIPALLQSWEKRATVSKLLKTYSAMQQAYQLAVIENGEPKNWNLDLRYAADNILHYFKVNKICRRTTDCITPYQSYNIDGGAYTMEGSTTSNTSVILDDGSTIYVSWVDLKCSGAKGHCFRWFVDLNGPKAPNRYGIDLFCFDLNNDGFVPWGDANSSYPFSLDLSCVGSNSMRCANWVIKKRNMDYWK